MKALEKDRARRYQSATDLAQDIQRYLNGEAILARPPSVGYQLQVFARRNKVVFAAIAAVFVVLIGASIVSLGLYLRADRARVEATQERVRAETASDESQAVTKFLSDMLTDVEPDKLGKDVSMRKVLDAASERIAHGLGDKPLIEARLRDTIGSTYLQLGLYEQAGVHFAAAVAIYQSNLGPEHATTLTSTSNLANAQLKLGQYAKAEETCRKILEVRRRVLGADHVNTLQAKHGLATAIYSQGKYSSAVELIRNVLVARTRVLGPEHPETLDSRDGLANCLRNMGRFAEAEELHRENLEIRLRLLGDKNTSTIASMSNLADVVAAQGRYHEAYELFRKVMENGRDVLGEEHPDMLRTMYAMSDALAGEGRFAESLDVQLQILEMRRRVLGPGHPFTHVSMLDVAGLLAELGETDRGELYRETLETFRARTAGDVADASDFGAYALLLLNREHRSLSDTETALQAAQCAVEMSSNLNPSLQDTLARAYHAAGQPNEAVEAQRKTLVLFRQVRSPNRAGFESRLGALLVEQRNYAEAEPLLLDSFEWMKEHVECVPERLHEFLQRIVKLYESWDSAEPGKGFGEKAAEYRAQISSERLGSSKP